MSLYYTGLMRLVLLIWSYICCFDMILRTKLNRLAYLNFAPKIFKFSCFSPINYLNLFIICLYRFYRKLMCQSSFWDYKWRNWRYYKEISIKIDILDEILENGCFGNKCTITIMGLNKIIRFFTILSKSYLGSFMEVFILLLITYYT